MTRRSIADAVNIIEGGFALSVGDADMPAPPGWTWHKLTDVARLESGHTPSRSQESYWNGPISWISIPDARRHHGGWITETAQTVTQEGIDNSAARLLPKGTVCLSRTASVGYVTVMGRPMATSQDFVNWVCSEAIDPDYLRCLLLAEKDALLRFGKGSTHTTIYFPEVQAFRVCAPPVDEQRRIVAKLDALRARSRRAKEALDAVPALLDKLRQSILAAAFRGDVTADWREANPDVEPASELLKRIRVERRKRWEEAELAKMVAKGKAPKDDKWKAKYVEPEPVDESDLPELPSGWCWTSWGEISPWITYGFTRPMPHVDAGPPIVTARHVNHSRVEVEHTDRTTHAAFEALSEKDRPRPGDILITKDGTIGRAAVVPEGAPPFCINQSVAVVWLRGCPIDRRFLLRVVESPATQRAISAAAEGMTVQHLSITDFARMPIPLPPKDECSVLVNRLDGALATAADLESSASWSDRELSSLDAACLASAFRGELCGS